MNKTEALERIAALEAETAALEAETRPERTRGDRQHGKLQRPRHRVSPQGRPLPGNRSPDAAR